MAGKRKGKATGLGGVPHPDVLAWIEWKRSPEGMEMCAGQASGVYLENRLWRAFMAGRETQRRERP